MGFCLVTVGTTEFRDLITGLRNQKFLNLLINSQIDKLVVQYGSGEPPEIDSSCGVEIETFTYKHGDEWKKLTRTADLIVSHAGAGSCLEALEYGRRLLVIINETLMDNHQEELAKALKEKHYLEYCLPKDLVDGLSSLLEMKLVQFPKGDPRPINSELRQLFSI